MTDRESNQLRGALLIARACGVKIEGEPKLFDVLSAARRHGEEVLRMMQMVQKHFVSVHEIAEVFGLENTNTQEALIEWLRRLHSDCQKISAAVDRMIADPNRNVVFTGELARAIGWPHTLDDTYTPQQLIAAISYWRNEGVLPPTPAKT